MASEKTMDRLWKVQIFLFVVMITCLAFISCGEVEKRSGVRVSSHQAYIVLDDTERGIVCYAYGSSSISCVKVR